MRIFIMLGRILAFASALVGCSRQPHAITEVPVIKNQEEHNRYYSEAGELVMSYMRLSNAGQKPVSNSKAQGDLRRAIVLFTAVVNYAPSNWNAYWLMGKSHQALGASEAAYEAFGKAYDIEKENADVAREYMFECLEIGRTSEGVKAAEHAVSIEPRNAGLLANLALAYTIAGQTSEALSKVEESLLIDPKDEITLNLKQAIREIIQGKKPQPQKLSDLSDG